MGKILRDFPLLLKEWHPTKNGNIQPEKIKFSSNKKFWWKCNAAEDHEWLATVNSRTRKNRNRGCPCCAGRAIVKSNCLAILCPVIASEWHVTKNNFTPFEIGYSSHKKVWWKGNCGHEWMASVNTRTNMSAGCPYCRGLKIDDTNSLTTVCSNIASQWHPTKNGNLKTDNVSVCSGKKVWWQCNKGHDWQARIADRAWGRNCPICNESKGEERIRQFLTDSALNFRRQATFQTCKYKQKLPFDFLVFKNEEIIFLIEYNGRHHYEPVKFAGNKWSDQKALEILKEVKVKDNIKKHWCDEENNIPLLVIPYWEFDNIGNIIIEFISHLRFPHKDYLVL